MQSGFGRAMSRTLVLALGSACLTGARPPVGLDPAGAIVHSVRWETGQLVIEADRPLQARVWTHQSPPRVVVDLHHAELADPTLTETLSVREAHVRQLRGAAHPDAGYVRFVLDCVATPSPRVVSGSDELSWRLDPGAGAEPSFRPVRLPVALRPASEGGRTVPSKSRPVLGPELPLPTIRTAAAPPLPRERATTSPMAASPRPLVPLGPELPLPLVRILPALGGPASPAPDSAPLAWLGDAHSSTAEATSGAMRLVTSRFGPARHYAGPAQHLKSWSARPLPGGGLEVVVRGEHPLVAEAIEEWAPSRFTVRVPRGIAAGSRDRTIPGFHFQVVRQGTDWALSCDASAAWVRWTHATEEQGRVWRFRGTPLAGRDRRPMVLVDAGHGGGDPGAIGVDELREASVTLALARALEHELARQGDVQVWMTRDSDVTVELSTRARLIQALRPDLVVSLHGNACSHPGTAGLETFYRHPESLPLARRIHRTVVERLGREDRGVRQARLYVLREPGVPSVLLESGYLTNPGDARLFRSPAYHVDLARAIALAVRTHLDRRESLRTRFARADAAVP
jgi:N-acetylmuramoyl-L-alanine amidase